MKKMILNLAFICAVAMAFANPPVTEQVLKQFSTTFPTVSNAKWFESDNHYDVYFEKDDVKHHIRYNRSGKIESTRNYFPGSKLCTYLKAKLAEKFPEKSIFGVTELTNSNEMYYVVILEDEKSWTNVRVDAIGQMDVMDKLYKSK